MKYFHKKISRRIDPPLIIDTKLNRPHISQNLVYRKWLLDKLNKGLSNKLTLVTAPAGFGKSMLVADWAAQSKTPSAWYSLGKEDNDVVVFWDYFIQSIRGIHPQLGKQSLDFLYNSNYHNFKNIIAVLINEINRLKDNFVIILDDFHVINDTAINSSMEYLLTHLPPQLHIYIISRAIPSLPLASLRANGQLLELSTDDLRFTFEEGKAFFDFSLKDFSLTPGEIMALHKRLEGWAAGMQLTSIILNNTSQKGSFIRNISDEQRHFEDYFYEEVLAHQPEEINRFLLQTSLLKKMHASLCNALTGNNNSQEILQYLEELNLFIIPLDNRRCWYRYHHYFAKILNTLLKQKEPDNYRRLHQKASIWFENKGYNVEAIYHALKGKHYDEAAELIEKEASSFFKTGELTTLYNWINSLPKEILQKKPVIWLYYVWILILSNRNSEAESTTLEIKEYLKKEEENSFIEKSLLSFVWSEVKIIEGYLAVLLEKNNATELFLEAIKYMQSDSLRQMITLNPGSVSLLQLKSVKGGRLKDAAKFYKTTEPGVKETSDLPSFAFGYAVLGEIHYETNEWEKAQKYLQVAIDLGSDKIDLGVLIPTYITASKIKIGTGKPRAALELLDLLNKKIKEQELQHWSSIIQARKVRISITMNDRDMVYNWLGNCQISIVDEITILQHYLFTTLARVYIYLEQPEKALLLTERMEVILEEEGGIGQKIENHILQALCYQRLNKMDRALKSAKDAIQMGAREGYYRIFIDEGEALYKLIKKLKTQQALLPSTEKCNRLLDYLERLHQGFIKENKNYYKENNQEVLETVKSLTIREREVLHLLAKGMSNKDIAEKLFISTITVKTHVRNIFRKLNVKTRAKAIARINELNLMIND